MKKEFSYKWQYLIKNLTYPYEYFNIIDDYKKLVNNLRKEGFFSKSRNKCPSHDEIQRTKGIFNIFDIKNREELTKLYLKGDLILLTDVFEKFI